MYKRFSGILTDSVVLKTPKMQPGKTPLCVSKPTEEQSRGTGRFAAQDLQDVASAGGNTQSIRNKIKPHFFHWFLDPESSLGRVSSKLTQRNQLLEPNQRKGARRTNGKSKDQILTQYSRKLQNPKPIGKEAD